MLYYSETEQTQIPGSSSLYSSFSSSTSSSSSSSSQTHLNTAGSSTTGINFTAASLLDQTRQDLHMNRTGLSPVRSLREVADDIFAGGFPLDGEKKRQEETFFYFGKLFWMSLSGSCCSFSSMERRQTHAACCCCNSLACLLETHNPTWWQWPLCIQLY